MAQEYELVDVQIDKVPFKDPHGNEWLTVAFKGISEPVKWVVKDKTKIRVGETYYGEVKETESKAGKSYRRFYREQRPDANPTYSASTADHKPSQSKPAWQPRDDSAIQAQWAINQSREYVQHMLGKDAKLTEILDTAKLFFGMIDQVKHSASTTQSNDAEMESLMDSLPSEEEIDINDIPF